MRTPETPLEFMYSQVFGIEVSEEQITEQLKAKEKPTAPKRPKEQQHIQKRQERRVPRDGKK